MGDRLTAEEIAEGRRLVNRSEGRGDQGPAFTDMIDWLWRNADRLLDAAEEADRLRPLAEYGAHWSKIAKAVPIGQGGEDHPDPTLLVRYVERRDEEVARLTLERDTLDGDLTAMTNEVRRLTPRWHSGAPPELKPGMLVETETTGNWGTGPQTLKERHFLRFAEFADGTTSARCECCEGTPRDWDRVTRWCQLPYPEEPT